MFFYSSHIFVWNYLVVKMTFERPTCCIGRGTFCIQVSCSNSSATSPTESLLTSYHTIPKLIIIVMQWNPHITSVRDFPNSFHFSHHYHVFSTIRPVQQRVIRVNGNPEELILLENSASQLTNEYTTRP